MAALTADAAAARDDAVLADENEDVDEDDDAAGRLGTEGVVKSSMSSESLCAPPRLGAD